MSDNDRLFIDCFSSERPLQLTCRPYMLSYLDWLIYSYHFSVGSCVLDFLTITTLQEMVINEELLLVNVGELTYYALPESLELLGKNLRRSELKILSPFDNLLIQRKRIQRLFDFHYVLECYVPEPKRQYGYFSLPVLWDGKLVARMDCKAERKKDLLHIQHLILEPGLTNTDAFSLALGKDLVRFMQFNNCSNLQLHRTSPANLRSMLQSEINSFQISSAIV